MRAVNARSALSGVFAVLPTPFDDNGAVDTNGFRRITDFVLKSGVDGIVFPGLASEYGELTIDERIDLIRIAGAAVNGRAAFVVGASDANHSRLLIDAGAEAGAECAMVITPEALEGDPDGLCRHYERLGCAGIPLMLQNAPRPMGIGLSADAVLEIVSAEASIAWVKEENMPCGQRITAIRQGAPPTLMGVFGGAGGRYITDELARGAAGTMPAAELPEAHVALMAAHRAGDDGRVRSFYEQMLPILMMQAVFRWHLTKEVLRRRGLISSAYVRAAGPRLDREDHRELTRMLTRVEALTGPMAQ